MLWWTWNEHYMCPLKCCRSRECTVRHDKCSAPHIKCFTPNEATLLAAILKIACWFVAEMWNLWHTDESIPALSHLCKLNVSLKMFGHLNNHTTSSKVADWKKMTLTLTGICKHTHSQIHTHTHTHTHIHNAPPFLRSWFVFKSSQKTPLQGNLFAH